MPITPSLEDLLEPITLSYKHEDRSPIIMENIGITHVQLSPNNTNFETRIAQIVNATLQKYRQELNLSPTSKLAFWSGQSVRERWPRNLKWSSLPICGGPFYRLDDCYLQCSGSDDNIYLTSNATILRDQQLLEAFAKTQAIFLDNRPNSKYPNEKLAEQARTVVQIMELAGRKSLPPAFVVLENNGKLECQPSSLLLDAQNIIKERRPWDRFVWSYRANFRILAERAFLSAQQIPAGIGEYMLPKERRTKPLEAHEWLSFSHPWALQILFAIQRDIESGDTNNVFPGLTFGSFDEKTGEQIAYFKWQGSGKYKPINRSDPTTYSDPDSQGYGTAAKFLSDLGMVLDTQKLRAIIGDIEAIARKRARERLNQTAFESESYRDQAIKAAGEQEKKQFFKLLEQKGRLTNRALHFLDLMPPELNDPDLMLRWRQGDKGFPTEEMIPSMDRWINQAFRALKKRMNELDPEGYPWSKQSKP